MSLIALIELFKHLFKKAKKEIIKNENIFVNLVNSIETELFKIDIEYLIGQGGNTVCAKMIVTKSPNGITEVIVDDLFGICVSCMKVVAGNVEELDTKVRVVAKNTLEKINFIERNIKVLEVNRIKNEELQ